MLGWRKPLLSQTTLFFFGGGGGGPHLQYIEVPRLGVESELQLPAYTAATATWDPSHVCDLCHSPPKCQILNLLSEARDQTYILMETSWVLFCCATMGTLYWVSFYFILFIYFCFLMAAPVAYGSSQAKGPIGATAAGLQHSHSNTISEWHLQPTPWLTGMWDP